MNTINQTQYSYYRTKYKWQVTVSTETYLNNTNFALYLHLYCENIRENDINRE